MLRPAPFTTAASTFGSQPVVEAATDIEKNEGFYPNDDSWDSEKADVGVGGHGVEPDDEGADEGDDGSKHPHGEVKSIGY